MNPHNRIVAWIALFVLCTTSGIASVRAQPTEDPPNLLFIFSDQFRRSSVGFLNEDPVQTPNIDKLAKSGFFFSRAVDRPDKQLCFGSEPSDPSSGTRGFRNHQYTFAVVKADLEKHYYLYDNIADPFQMTNIWGQDPALDKQMERDLEMLLSKMKDPW